MALLAIRDCERELDLLEAEVDNQLPEALVRVSETRAREYLAALRFATELERVTDLAAWIAERIRTAYSPSGDKFANEHFSEVSKLLERMIVRTSESFSAADPAMARSVIMMDREIDAYRNGPFQRLLNKSSRSTVRDRVEVLLIAQAFERIGDHITNVAEEIIRLVGGRSVRHTQKKRSAD
jgi:phosphate transport system protein